MAQIALEGIEFNVQHGLYELEKNTVGLYCVDIYIFLKNKSLSNSDKIADTVDYEKVYQICAQRMNKPVNLLETLAINIASDIKQKLLKKGKVKVRISKMNPPFPHVVQRSYVEYKI